MEINKTTLSIAAGVAGTLFLGYCIYFDKKRRSDPDYKKKIRESKFEIEKCFHSFISFFFLKYQHFWNISLNYIKLDLLTLS